MCIICLKLDRQFNDERRTFKRYRLDAQCAFGSLHDPLAKRKSKTVPSPTVGGKEGFKNMRQRLGINAHALINDNDAALGSRRADFDPKGTMRERRTGSLQGVERILDQVIQDLRELC